MILTLLIVCQRACIFLFKENEKETEYLKRKNSLNNDRALHEGIEWYDKCTQRKRNEGIRFNFILIRILLINVTCCCHYAKERHCRWSFSRDSTIFPEVILFSELFRGTPS